MPKRSAKATGIDKLLSSKRLTDSSDELADAEPALQVLPGNKMQSCRPLVHLVGLCGITMFGHWIGAELKCCQVS